MARDPLFEIKNAFYLGNFQHCINEAQKAKVQPELKFQKDLFMYRAYIAQKKYSVVIEEIRSGSPKEYLALRTLAEYLSSDSVKRSKIVDCLEQMINSVDSEDFISFIVVAIIYFHEENYDAVLRVLHNVDNLECSAMAIQTYLKMDRVDLARKEMKKMQERDDDATLTQMAQAWINLAMGGEKIQEAYYIFQELQDKYGSTTLLLNGQAVTLMACGKHDEAESFVQEALEKNSNNPEALINSIVISQFLGKAPEVSNRFLNQLKESVHNHPFVKDYEIKEKEINNLIKQYAI